MLTLVVGSKSRLNVSCLIVLKVTFILPARYSLSPDNACIQRCNACTKRKHAVLLSTALLLAARGSVCCECMAWPEDTSCTHGAVCCMVSPAQFYKTMEPASLMPRVALQPAQPS